MERADRIMIRVVLGALTILLLTCGLLLWRVSNLVATVDRNMEAIARDVAEVTHTAADLSKDVRAISERVDQLSDKTKTAARLDQAEHALDELVAIRQEERPVGEDLSANARTEIEWLLKEIRKFDGKFGHDDDLRSPNNYYLRLSIKFKTYEDTLRNAEDFIDKVATKTMGGERYFAVKGETATPLDEWLRRKLEEKRKGAPPSQEARLE